MSASIPTADQLTGRLGGMLGDLERTTMLVNDIVRAMLQAATQRVSVGAAETLRELVLPLATQAQYAAAVAADASQVHFEIEDWYHRRQRQRSAARKQQRKKTAAKTVRKAVAK